MPGKNPLKRPKKGGIMEALKKVLTACLICLTLAMIYFCLCFRYSLGVAPSGIACLDRLTGKVTLSHQGEAYKVQMVRK